MYSQGTYQQPISVIDITAAPNGRLMGIPIMTTDLVPALGTQGDAGLYDFSYYLVGDRGQIVVDWSKEYEFAKIQQAVRIYKRLDGTPWMDATFTPRKGDAKSPFVALN
jgi:HK97 family phage major capsid protein